MSSPIGRACKQVEIVASWHLCGFALVQLRFSGRLVRPTLRGALLGLEIGTSQNTLPVVVGRFRRTPHIVLSGAFLALRASDYRYVVCQREGCEKALFPGRVRLRLGG